MTAVRKRCEECRQVKRIFANMRIRVEERDVFMNAKYQTELDDRIGRIATVPQVFISGQLVGGAAKIEELNETGELQKMLADFEVGISVCMR
jgi:glutaredoxin-related protein